MRTLIISLALLVAVTSPAPAEYENQLEEALAEYEKGYYSTAFNKFLPLAKQGVAEAQHHLALMYDTEHPVPEDNPGLANWFRLIQNDEEAEKWYRKAAEQGHVGAQFKIGHMYNSLRGALFPIRLYGYENNKKRAVRWFRLAAEQGHPQAQFKLGMLYLNGYGVPKDYVEAVKWYRKAAEQGLADAQNRLANMYHDGLGLPKDYGQAVEWYRKAVDQDLAVAQYNLAGMYWRGHGVPQDEAEAKKWCRKAAANSFAAEQYELGLTFKGFAADADETLRVQYYSGTVDFFRLAAELGHGEAQMRLAGHYGLGQWVPMDHVLAYMWANLAAARLSGENAELAAAARHAAAGLMTAAQIAEAQKLSREWRVCGNLGVVFAVFQ